MWVFCSASKKVSCCWAFKSFMISNTSSTIYGARPMRGSSSRANADRIEYGGVRVVDLAALRGYQLA